MIPQGLMATVWIESCQFDNNTDVYFLEVNNGKILKPVQIGMGTVCVTSSNVWFRKNVTFTKSHGSALVVSGGSVSFDGTYALFADNYANKGGGILLLGASTIEVGFGTDMVFRNNTAIYRGGAMHIVYISRENLKTDANSFVRHTDPSISPENWNVTVTFIDNWELQRSSRNAIYATSILPCSVLGGSGIVTDKTKVLCWRGWSYYEASTNEKPVQCYSQIASDIGYIDYIGSIGEDDSYKISNHVQAFPGWNFSLPVRVLDDFNNVIGNQVVFMIAPYGNYQDQSLVYGKSATVLGLENKSYHMTLATQGERIWYGEIHVDLQQCPPGFTAKNGTCTCAGTYGGEMFCNYKAKEANLSQGYWMQLLDGSYYITQCPPSYCKKNRDQFVLLPHKHEELNSKLCAPERTGGLCGECVPGYGPAVNSPSYRCVNCTDINLGANIAKYVASLYIPLATLFTVLILFDIRLTTGPANAFILYCQVVSSTFNLDANGGIPLDHIMSHSFYYIYAYKFPYGIFNLEFIENFLPPICLSTSFNTLTVLCLDYCVAFSPLIMIVLVLIIFKLKELCTLSGRRVSLASKPSILIRKRIKNIGEALLPAFASFILLSYTKFSTTSAYILATHTLVDENGSQYGDTKYVYMAGQLTSNSKQYYPYYITAIIICCTFVSIPPLLLLDYPLRALEWIISKSSCFQRLYPADKVHILMDTFQGCYRNNMRFFAGVYFLFRLLFNVISYPLLETWLNQFVMQQITSSLMAAFVAICRPYKKNFLNCLYLLTWLLSTA